MKATTTKPRMLTAAGWLCALALAACDDPDAGLAEDAAAVLDVVSEDELRDLCELAEEEAAAPPIGPDDLADSPHPAKGECIDGYWDYPSVDESCGTCWHDVIQKWGFKRVNYKRWCYKAPSPVSCGCEPATVMNWWCVNECRG